jgi:hypothetical protein
MLSTFVNLLQGSTYQSLYSYKYFHDVTLSLQTYILMSWIMIDFCGTGLKEVDHSFAYLFHASHFCPCIVSFYIGNFTNLSSGIHPNWIWMIFRWIFWRFFGKISRYIIYGGLSIKTMQSFDMEDAPDDFKRFIEEYKDFVLL